VDPGKRQQIGGQEAEERQIQLLAARARDGDVDAFEQLYRRFAGLVHGISLRLSGDSHTAEILTQDAFVRAWERLPGYRGEGPFGAWLRRLTVNVALEDRRIETRRRRRTRPLQLAEPGAPELQVPAPRGPGRPGEGRPLPAETALDLERAIAGLPAGARTIFVLHDVEGFGQQEIARMTGLAVGTIKAQLHRARRLLRLALNAEVGVCGR
jgi:RNA polymerase sigma-70 factor, ECF subfamily